MDWSCVGLYPERIEREQKEAQEREAEAERIAKAEAERKAALKAERDRKKKEVRAISRCRLCTLKIWGLRALAPRRRP